MLERVRRAGAPDRRRRARALARGRRGRRRARRGAAALRAGRRARRPARAALAAVRGARRARPRRCARRARCAATSSPTRSAGSGTRSPARRPARCCSSAAAGAEFTDWGGAAHVGGGSHGSLSAGDSHAPLIWTAALEGELEREQWSIADVAPLVAAHFGLGVMVRARRRARAARPRRSRRRVAGGGRERRRRRPRSPSRLPLVRRLERTHPRAFSQVTSPSPGEWQVAFYSARPGVRAGDRQRRTTAACSARVHRHPDRVDDGARRTRARSAATSTRSTSGSR